MKKVLATLVFILFNLLVAAACLEVYVRVKHGALLGLKAREQQYRRADFTFDHSLIPGASAVCATREWNVPYRINRMGFRDREFASPKPDGVYRILALGDSYLEGYGVKLEDSFIKRFEASLAGRPGPARYEVINGGIASYSPLLEYLLLRHRLDEIDPDMVMLVYDVGDLKDDYEYEKTVTFDEKGRPLSATPFDRAWVSNATAFRRFMIRHFRGYLYLDNKLNKFFFKLKNRHRSFQDEYTDVVHHDSFIAYRPGQQKNVSILWERNRKYLTMIAELLKERGVKLVIVSYPYGFQFHPQEWAEGRLHQGFKADTVYDRPAHLDTVAAFAREIGVPFVDLYDGFKARYEFPVQFPYDGHLNERGHRIMAEALTEAMSAVL